MAGKKVSLSEENEERVYYVEDVDGDDFTFYLRPEKEDQKHLLPPENVSQDGQELPEKKRFSYATNIKVVKISPLLKLSDLIDDGKPLLTELTTALTLPKKRSKSKSAWRALVNALPRHLQKEVQSWSKDKTNVDLLQRVLKKLNALLVTNDMAHLLSDHRNVLDEIETRRLERFSKVGRKAYENRKRFDKHYGTALKPVRSELSPINGRALICRSYRDQLLSISFRQKSVTSSYKPDDSDEYTLSMDQYCTELFNAIFKFDGSKGSTSREPKPAKRGLLVISGETNSSKSEIATGLIYKYLEGQRNRKRRPHLVTFEDPIEKFYAETGRLPGRSRRSVKTPAARKGIDYTPRENGNADEGRDVSSLQQAFSDALRQTPTVFFVGETRHKEDWEQLIDFAGTGHLIVSTAHAGALTEAMRKIFDALKIRTPAERNEIANRLLGIIHIRHHPDTGVLVPAIWRRTQAGTNALTAEGLSSLLPYKPAQSDASLAQISCLGRAWFADQLVKRIGGSKLKDEEKNDLITKAIEWDLEGV